MPRQKRRPHSISVDPTDPEIRPAKNSDLPTNQWQMLRQTILEASPSETPASVLGAACDDGSVYRWGMATAKHSECDRTLELLSRLAAGAKIKQKQLDGFDFSAAAQKLMDELSGSTDDLLIAAKSIVWSAALPGLLEHLSESQWWNVLGAIQNFRDSASHHSATRPQSLLAVAEIGITLAWRLHALPSCRRLQESSINVIHEWFSQEDESINQALEVPDNCRLVLASLLRCKRILEHHRSTRRKKNRTLNRAWKKSYDEVASELASWLIALVRDNGSQTLCPLGKDKLTSAKNWRHDLGEYGLLQQICEFNIECLPAALKCGLGNPDSAGTLSWQIGLPESMLHQEDSSLACLMPDWDVRRGRFTVSYRKPETTIELSAGKSPVISGPTQTFIAADGHELVPRGDWITSCEFTDDDVHYLELEIPYSEGFLLQRQLMVIRDDRCCFLADAIVQGSQYEQRETDPLIEYQLRLPLTGDTDCRLEADTTDAILYQGTKKRAMVLPLSAPEWRLGPSNTQMVQSEDSHLVIRSQGKGQLYTPLWVDFTRSRFRAKRTWRNLTVAQSLEPTPVSDAVAFRVQVGSEQWILYRSLSGHLPRTFFGRHMIADFYCSRFDAEDQSFEELVTVDPNDEAKEGV